MTKAIFTTKPDPTYDDLPEIRYHFPRTYLGTAEAAVGDWIIYYEPRRSSGDLSSKGGRLAYFAVAKLNAIHPDPNLTDHFYALVSDYLEFDEAVPFREGGHYYESALQREDGATNKGQFGRAIRLIPDAEYDMILRRGFAPILTPTQTAAYSEHSIADEPESFERPLIERVVSRPFRDAAFAIAVKAAYDNTCAITGLQIINGGGRAEAQAAHIRPVAAQGPDSVRNGLALCGTAHWMFDRGLLSIADDYSLLLAKGRVPDPVVRMINPDGKLRLPQSRHDLWPHHQFLRYHRENVFKG